MGKFTKAASGVALGVALAVSLAGCAGASSSSSSTSAASSALDAADVSTSSAASASAYDVLTFAEDEIDEIYTFELEGVEYALPCSVDAFVQAGWQPVAERTIQAEFCASSPTNYFQLGDDETKRISLDLLNTSDAEVSWDACRVVGIVIEGDGVAFSTSRGISVGDSVADVQEAYGASSHDIDRFGTIGYNFFERADASMAGYRWYGQAADALSFTTVGGLYPGWEDDVISWIRLSSFSGIDPSEDAATGGK